MTQDKCNHGLEPFPETEEAIEALKHFTAYEIREAWPRFYGKCACGFSGITYSSYRHYIYGDW